MFAILKRDEICEVLRFAGVAATGVFGQTHAEGQQMVVDPYLWHDLYDLTQHQVADDSREVADDNDDRLPLRKLIERPFGNAAMGWTVLVRQQSGFARGRVGVVTAYDAQRDAFLVKYEDSPDEQWEREVATHGRVEPQNYGKSRFFFVAGPQFDYGWCYFSFCWRSKHTRCTPTAQQKL